MTIHIEIEGLDEVLNNLDTFGRDLPKYMKGAGIEASNEILNEKGLRNYPPATEANLPPPPYYIRGRGMQTSASRNDGRSERLGTRWEVLSYALRTVIRNPVSYAKWVHGTEQARAMSRIGWKILVEVAKEKTQVIETIYNKWVNKLLKSKGL